MRWVNERGKPHVEFDAKEFELAAGDWEKMREDLMPLRKAVRDFPVSDLYITAQRFARNGGYHVKTALILPGRTLFTGDQDRHVPPAFGRCVRKLVRKVAGYKYSLAGMPEITKREEGTRQEVVAVELHDGEAVVRAVDENDYAAFRSALYMYEEPVRKRVGRWIQRYPALNAQVGNGIKLADVVEEVFLNAFERYGHWPAGVRLGDWLETQIDPAIRALTENPEAEMENVRFAQTWREAVSGRA